MIKYVVKANTSHKFRVDSAEVPVSLQLCGNWEGGELTLKASLNERVFEFVDGDAENYTFDSNGLFSIGDNLSGHHVKLTMTGGTPQTEVEVLIYTQA